ncbi:hypothetical protein HC031_30420 [Planosporangium thailandense]|uniref:Uncharacterized protein n=1 Tax=Planosporangium thailandense TaxID=765197 RepID=A0ABX0Y6F2_9ACTN|nr:hypothetical protein [Planosporangium thailandense]NJC73996.1 hypothetical protein [Planosporangium thailandense]
MERASFEIDARARRAIDRFNAVMQPELDRLLRRCAGAPVEQVRAELAKVWGANAGKALPEPYLTSWATSISRGDRVRLS